MNKFDIVQVSEPDLAYLTSVLKLSKATPDSDECVKTHNQIIDRLLEHVRLALPCNPTPKNHLSDSIINYAIDKLSSVD